MASYWKGPEESGISFSSLCKWIVCPERARLYLIEGLREEEFSSGIAYGEIWHGAEEDYHRAGAWKTGAKKAADNLKEEYPANLEDIDFLYKLCLIQFPIYLNEWNRDPNVRKRESLLQEPKFWTPYRLPSGRTVHLYGYIDQVFREGKYTYLQENKTKERIDELGLSRTVALNLQNMYYLIAYNAAKLGPRSNRILYNVIRKPATTPHKGRGKARKGKETWKQFEERLSAAIRKDPGHYFKRWKVHVTQADVKRFTEQCLNPLLERLCDWWAWISVDPHNPWRLPSPQRPWRTLEDATVLHGDAEIEFSHKEVTLSEAAVLPPIPGGGIHYQTPFGVYNPLGQGLRGDYFSLLTSGSKKGLTKRDDSKRRKKRSNEKAPTQVQQNAKPRKRRPKPRPKRASNGGRGKGSRVAKTT